MSSKIGRNEPCPCGSGKKYKKCCIDQPEKNFINERVMEHFERLWTYEKVDGMTTFEIIQQLESYGIIFDENVFLRDIQAYYSAQQLSDYWFDNFFVSANDEDEDFPWLAAWILWERLAPTHILSMEQMSELIDQGIDYMSEKDASTACDIWLTVWDSIKYRYKPEFKNMDFLNKQYQGSFYIRDFCQDLSMALHNAGLNDKTYFEKRINFCKELITYFPNEDELLIHNMRCDIAESYLSIDRYEQAEMEYEKLVQDYPDNPWGFIGWGDLYFDGSKKNYAKAKELYEKALELAEDKIDIDAIKERIEDLPSEPIA